MAAQERKNGNGFSGLCLQMAELYEEAAGLRATEMRAFLLAQGAGLRQIALMEMVGSDSIIVAWNARIASTRHYLRQVMATTSQGRRLNDRDILPMKKEQL